MSSKIKIVPYRGLSNGQRIKISGHVFENHRIKDAKEHHKHYYNLKQAIRRFSLVPLKKTKVSILVGNEKTEVVTDKSGFYSCVIEQNSIPKGWHKYRISHANCEDYVGEIYHPGPHTTAVISDIDDTILISHSTRLLKKLNLILFRNAHTRKPIPLIKNWHQHLHEINEKIHPKDFFYVSNSEWNLYDFILDFFDINKLPKGVFFLQNLKHGLKDLIHSGSVNSNHKMESIQFLFDFFPRKPLILVGDNGQKDIEIYSHFCETQSSRIKGVMIRKVPKVKEEYRLKRLSMLLKEKQIPLTTYH